MPTEDRFPIDVSLVRRLVAGQFPQWADLTIQAVEHQGWDNHTFHLGKTMSIRLPSAAVYAPQVEKEHRWLPTLAPFLPLPIPAPLAMGKPAEGYPWAWSIYRWFEGQTAAIAPINDLNQCAAILGKFLVAMHRCDPKEGPRPGPHSFFRGGPLAIYNSDTRQAIASLQGRIDDKAALKLWEKALASSWSAKPVWVHGDISAGNLLVREGQLSAIIDFGQLVIGDPACDLAIAWTMFKGDSREVFRRMLALDADTWVRARAWALWKAVIIAAGFTKPHNYEAARCWEIIADVLADCR